jgi:hypothetical protein
MKQILRIEELASPCLSRARGQEAFDKLLPLVAGKCVTIDLDCAETLSTSFLDEFVSRLNESHALDLVCFVTARQRVRRKLSQISTVRDLDLYASLSAEESASPLPRVSLGEAPEFELKD